MDLSCLDKTKLEFLPDRGPISEVFDTQKNRFIKEFHVISGIIHEMCKEKGFWDNERNDGEMIALMHSELSEALEGIRHGNPPDSHLPKFNSAEVELADCIIRIMDMGYGRGYKIAEALIEKMKYNNARPHKHGKGF